MHSSPIPYTSSLFGMPHRALSPDSSLLASPTSASSQRTPIPAAAIPDPPPQTERWPAPSTSQRASASTSDHNGHGSRDDIVRLHELEYGQIGTFRGLKYRCTAAAWLIPPVMRLLGFVHVLDSDGQVPEELGLEVIKAYPLKPKRGGGPPEDPIHQAQVYV